MTSLSSLLSANDPPRGVAVATRLAVIAKLKEKHTVQTTHQLPEQIMSTDSIPIKILPKLPVRSLSKTISSETKINTTISSSSSSSSSSSKILQKPKRKSSAKEKIIIEPKTYTWPPMSDGVWTVASFD